MQVQNPKRSTVYVGKYWREESVLLYGKNYNNSLVSQLAMVVIFTSFPSRTRDVSITFLAGKGLGINRAYTSFIFSEAAKTQVEAAGVLCFQSNA